MLVSADGLTQMTTAFRLPAVQLAVSRAGVPASQIDSYVEQIVEDPRVVRIQTAKEIKWTTVELVEKEQSLISLLTAPARENRAPVVEAAGGGSGDHRLRRDAERGAARRGSGVHWSVGPDGVD